MCEVEHSAQMGPHWSQAFVATSSSSHRQQLHANGPSPLISSPVNCTMEAPEGGGVPTDEACDGRLGGGGAACAGSSSSSSSTISSSAVVVSSSFLAASRSSGSEFSACGEERLTELSETDANPVPLSVDAPVNVSSTWFLACVARTSASSATLT